MEGGGAGSIYGVEGCAGGVADVVEGHAGGFAATELREDGPNCYILDVGGRKVGVLVQGGAEDLGLERSEKRSGTME